MLDNISYETISELVREAESNAEDAVRNMLRAEKNLYGAATTLAAAYTLQELLFPNGNPDNERKH